MLASLEEATLPIQDYLGVDTTRSQTEQVTVSRLPKPLATLYEKLKVFSRNFPKFELSVKVKGLSDADDSESNPDVEMAYMAHTDAQVLENPINKFKALRKMRKEPNIGLKDAKSVGISEHSKRIKKEKKNPLKISKEEKQKKLAAALEEGEEGMIVSQEENSQMSGSSDSDAVINYTEQKLIEKYEKFPGYLRILFKKPETFFEFTDAFNCANRESVSNILSSKSKDIIAASVFPFKLIV